MKKQLIYIFTISLLFGVFGTGHAQNSDTALQETPEETSSDTLIYREKYGLRLGTDLSKLVRTFIEKDYTGFEIVGDFRLTERFYPAAEIGHEDYTFSENNFTTNSQGQYLKLGVNYNAYHNWIGMQNEIYTALRYGFATFSENLQEFTIYDKDHYFGPDHREIGQKFSGLNAHWLEFQIGIKAEVLNNLYLGIHADVKRMITDKSPKDFANLWIPGYNQRYEDTEFGVGWGYTLTYSVPIIRKERKEKQQ